MKKARIAAATLSLLIAGKACPVSLITADITAASAVEELTENSAEEPEYYEIAVQYSVKYAEYKDHAVAMGLSEEYVDMEEPFDIDIPDEIEGIPVTEILPEAFSLSNVQNVKLGKNIKTIGDYAFNGCSYITEIKLPADLERLGSSVFCECRGLEKVTFNDKLVSIGRKAFMNCRALTSAELPDSLVKIDENAFSGCQKLSKVRFGANIASIGAGAFNSINMTYMEIPSSVSELNGCPLLYTDYDELPDMAIRIDNSDCVLGGDRSEWKEFIIICDEGSAPAIFAEEKGIRHCTYEQYKNGKYDRRVETEYGDVFSNNTMSWCMVEGGYEVFDITMGDAEELVIPDEIDGVPVVAVSNNLSSRENNTKVKKIVIGKNVKTIWSAAFFEYPALEEVVCGEKLETIMSLAFYGCEKLQKVIFNEKLKTIEHMAFFNCTSLTDINCPGSVTSLKQGTFYLCSPDFIILPESVKYVEQSAINVSIDYESSFSNPSVIVVLNPECDFEPSSISGSRGIWILGYSGSTAEIYAKENGLLFRVLEKPKESNDMSETEDMTDETDTDRCAGDTNCDGTVDLSDVVLILQALANPDKYWLEGTDPSHLTTQGLYNGDVCYYGSGITAKDALWIQNYLLGDTESLN